MNNPFPVPQETVEAGLLHGVGQNMANWLEVTKYQPEDFANHREIFAFINSYLQQYGSLPSASQIGTRFEWNPPVGDFAYWNAEMKRYSLARKVQEAMQDALDKMGQPEEALSLLLNRLGIIRSHQTNHIQATDASAGRRLEMFDVRTQSIFHADKILGIRTGMKVLDETYIGWIPGSLVGCYARPGVGKTWWLLWQGTNCWVDGGTVLAITPEMPANFLNLRIDTLLASAMSLPIDYGKLIIGNPDIRANYELLSKAMAQSQRWWTYDSLEQHAISVGDVAALIRLHKPDVVLIDGVSLLRSEARGQMWEQMKEICYGLKNLATIYEVPVIVTHQAVNSNRGRRSEPTTVGRGDDFIMPSLNDAAYGDSFVAACSDVITMCGEPTSQHVNWYSIRKSRERGWKKPLEARMAFAVDFATGRILDLSYLGHAPEAVGQESRRLLGV